MAIAYDNSRAQSISAGGSLSYSFTVAPNAYLFAVTTAKTTGVTYNGAAMTLLVDFAPSIGGSPGITVRLWGLANPSSGSNLVVFAVTNPIGADETSAVISYTGLSTTQPLLQNTNFSNNGSTNTAVTGLNTNLNGVPGTWTTLFAIGANSSRTFTAGTGTLRATDSSGLAGTPVGVIDSNGNVTGTSSLQANWSAGTGLISTILVALNPITTGEDSDFFLTI